MGKLPSEDAKYRIMKAAAYVVSQQGGNKATIREIAKVAGLSTGAIYHYYQSKEEILYELLDQSLNGTIQTAEKTKAQNMTKEEMKSTIYDATLERFTKQTESRLQFQLMNEIITGNEELQIKFNEKYQQWITAIKEVLQNTYGLEEHRLSRPLATWIMAGVDGVVLQTLLKTDTDQEGMYEVLDLLIQEGLPHFIGLLNQQAKKESTFKSS
ncbi:TetR/AcrR family transcriptional regulator [Caldalkalibacillus mannanilyticus]|uniref:TetR/AcrR family transcriptional regulator n=1 Tax=Caldalkalibacillus mannanilyticus TaxID=1418 RepID=UPI00046A7AA7|nr:TetR/AcrR family transcriptional regulator [Caldalkalibacillus mannanilyticus]